MIFWFIRSFSLKIPAFSSFRHFRNIYFTGETFGSVRMSNGNMNDEKELNGVDDEHNDSAMVSFASIFIDNWFFL